MRVLYWAVHDPTYPRNARIRAFLEHKMGAEVVIVPKPTIGSRLARVRRLLRHLKGIRRGDFDVVVLSEFSVQFAVTARLAAARTRAILVTDFFVGLEETEIGDFKLHKEDSLRARLLRKADRYAISQASLALTDTEARASRFSQKFRKEFLSLPVGAPEWARMESKGGRDIDFLYYGSYLPLHGVDLLVPAIADPKSGVRNAVFIGSGPNRAATERRAALLESSVEFTFIDDLPANELGNYLGRARAVAGIFGDSLKAREVIANKVWQGLYAGARVVTRASPALDEIRDVVGDHLLEVSDVTPAGITTVIATAVAVPPTSLNPARALDSYVADKYASLEAALSARTQIATRA